MGGTKPEQPTSLYALASHAAGDFPLQTGWMAENKFDSASVRAVHVAVYCLAFIPFALSRGWSRKQVATFFMSLAGTHFAIDSRRWNDAVPIWFDQALHVIALAVSVSLANRGGSSE